MILGGLPYVEVERWEPSSEGDEPRIAAVYRLAQHPLAPHIRIEFTIEWLHAVDGSHNLCYVINRIEEEEAQDPHGG